MSLLEDWEAGSSFHEPAQGFIIDEEGLAVSNDPLPPAPTVDQSIFGLHTTERQLSRCSGAHAEVLSSNFTLSFL